MKNDFFSLNRFGHLIKKTLIENWVSIFGITTAAVFLMFINFIFISQDFKYAQATSINIILFFSAIILTSVLLNKFDSKPKSYDFLLFPASSFEKLMAVLFIVYCVHIVGFLVFHQIFTHTFYNGFLAEHNLKPQYEKPEILLLSDEIFRPTYKIILFFQLFMTSGAFYFKKNALLKSIFVFIIAAGLIYVLNRFISGLMLDASISGSMPFSNIVFNKGSAINEFVVMKTEDSNLIRYIFTLILPICFLFISYFKLKEKEV